MVLLVSSYSMAEKTPVEYPDTPKQESEATPDNLESKPTFCARLLKAFTPSRFRVSAAPRPTPGTPEYKEALWAKYRSFPKSFEAFIALSYLLELQKYEWTWDERAGKVRVSIVEGSELAGVALFQVSKFLGFVIEGLEIVENGEAEYAKPNPTSDRFPKPTYMLSLNVNPTSELTQLSQVEAGFGFDGNRVEFIPRHTNFQTEAIVTESTMDVSQAAVGQNSVDRIGGAKELYLQTERLSLLEIRISGAWLEVRNTPAHIKWMRQEIERLTSKYIPYAY